MGRRVKSWPIIRIASLPAHAPLVLPPAAPPVASPSRIPMSQALHPCSTSPSRRPARAGRDHQPRLARPRDLLRVNTKAPNDFVTEVDQAAEARRSSRRCCGAYPGHGILAEESGRAHGAKDSDYVWIIDPLDGTTNFIHGFPVYCGVDRASRIAGQVQQAVVYDPTRNDLFYRLEGPRRLPQRQAPARLQAHAAGGLR